MAKVRVGVSLGLVRVSDRISLWLVSVRVMIPKPKTLTHSNPNRPDRQQ